MISATPRKAGAGVLKLRARLRGQALGLVEVVVALVRSTLGSRRLLLVGLMGDGILMRRLGGVAGDHRSARDGKRDQL